VVSAKEIIKTDSHHEWESAAQKDGADLHPYSTKYQSQIKDYVVIV